ncbi:glycosyltransferase family 4 protein [Corynebacterium sp. 320]|uniref:glycosyltransferase family 4 protein n=1 Tax=Corynebacterium TaxID=1716 RepID=UPI00125CAAAB|nr:MULTISPECIES: glycosyltransferase family 4 protein [Corynebacterium]KAB1502483.1 glycosyltransferase family 4 protein [Corynebacterium sp. 320]KAB1551296.1 glycosyltransferase family 4 protein [Corynebacterium sp. 321]KAB1551876.1 glycosyltransferase family 4 protein [Corynebacterium sp. 319]KAB3526090.1 glycosyltransferase family 4 protein [Corynebacterium sp. 250]KAB3538870.1 glycosyltransferase family 4 protein [Corynebacterium sp. 366]
MPASHPRVLVVTNDFPPTVGGIQSYLRDYVATLDPSRVVVFASTQDGDAATIFDAERAYTVVRWPRTVMLPTPAVARRMAQLIREHDIHTVWFGAAAPLAALAPQARRAGARRIIASTHGHEVGWSMLPGARQVLRYIGRHVDTLTYVSRYARNRFAGAFGPDVGWEPMPGGVDTTVFRPQPELSAQLRRRHGLEDASVIVAVSRLVPRKGQDTLIKALPTILKRVPNAHLLLVGPGDYRSALRRLAVALGVEDHVTMTGPVDFAELAGYYGAGDVFALPVRTQLGGLSVEGLGIVFLEAQACGVATVAGNGGGAPETVIDGSTGLVVDGRSPERVADTLADLLNNPEMRHQLADRGVTAVNHAWTWDALGAQLRAVIAGDGGIPPRHSWNAAGDTLGSAPVTRD